MSVQTFMAIKTLSDSDSQVSFCLASFGLVFVVEFMLTKCPFDCGCGGVVLVLDAAACDWSRCGWHSPAMRLRFRFERMILQKVCIKNIV